MFPRFPFFYWSTLDNTEIRLGPNLFERRGKHNYWNRILFSFVWLFRGVTTVIRKKMVEKIVKIALVWWTISLFLGQFFCSLDNFFVLEQKNCPYKTTMKNKDFCLFDEGRKSQNKWEKMVILFVYIFFFKHSVQCRQGS